MKTGSLRPQILLSESVRRTAFDDLLTLKHQRVDEGIRAGLHENRAKKAASKKRKTDATAPQGELIKPPQQELF